MTILQKFYNWHIPHKGNDHKPKAIRHKTLAIYSGLLIATKVLVLILLFFTYPTQAEFSTITVNRIIQLTNKERVKLGLSELKHNRVLDLAAQKKAEDMLKKNYFAHTSPDGIKPWHWFKEVDYNYTFAGENLAMNFVEAEDAMTAWMNSPTHKDNIVNKNYEDIGIAVAVGKLEGYQTTLVVQLFGKTYGSVAGEIFMPNSPPIESEQLVGPVNIVSQSAKQEVKLERKKHSGFMANVIKYADKFFFILLGFVILNLILTIIIRIEIQHKPIILHCLWVIFLALTMILFNAHFIEQIKGVVNII